MKFHIEAIFIFILILLFMSDANAQEEKTYPKRNYISFEYLGPNGFGSVQYERIFIVRDQNRYFLKLGIGSFHIIDFSNKVNPDIIIPFSSGVSLKKKPEFLAAGGMIFSSIVHYNSTKGQAVRENDFHPFASVSCRYVLEKSRIGIQLSYMQVYDINQRLKHRVALALGYRF
jgi:hypothetical protein